MKKEELIQMMTPQQSVYDGLLMTAGILASTYVVGKVSKSMAPQLTTKNAVSLATVTILSQVGIDYAKQRKLLPDNM